MTNRAILVDLEESSSRRVALEWAVQHARLTGGVLRAVHVLDWPRGRPTGRILTHEEIEDL